MLSSKFSTQAAGPQLLLEGVLSRRGGFAIFAGVGLGFVLGSAIGGIAMLVEAAGRGSTPERVPAATHGITHTSAIGNQSAR